MDTNTAPAARPAYFRTTFGTHRHANRYCANVRRALTSTVEVIPADQVDEYPSCVHCATGAELELAKAQAERDAAEARATAAAKAASACVNSGVTHPQRIQSTCRDCGKLGTVNRSTGRLRAHKPAPPARSTDDLY